jgi:MFS family permease
LIVVLALLHIPPLQARRTDQSIWASIGEGFSYVRQRKLIWQLMSLDFAATFCIGYRVLLPSLARDVLGVGAAGYGILLAAPAAGAIVGSAVVYRLRNYPRRGALVLAATVGYALAAIALGQSQLFALAVIAAGGLGVFDAITTTLRHAVVQLDTPDHLRGRVTSAYQMVSRGGPSLGQLQMGAIASAVGPPLALLLGASVTIAYTAWLALAGTTVRRYTAAPAESESST